MKTTILVLFAAFTILPGSAQQLKPIDVKVGLWESTNTSEMSGMPAMPAIPPDKLAQVPPEQRARIEAMMKGRGGSNTSTTRSCLTKESLERGLNFLNDKSCVSKTTSSSSS